ncbi:VanZ family protein [Actinoplanes sp. NPDC049668]|uniref:VanZ family protein n=1 Tax=unclassified Actinoplanes TaxID=2626549 RepID=UPI0033A66E4B
MSPDQLHVPALPILLPLGTVLMAVSWMVLRGRGLLTAGRFVALSAAGWYLVAVLGATMLPLWLAWGENAGEPELYRIILVPLTTVRVDDFLLNIVMTLPLAAVLRLVFDVRDKGRVVLVGFLLSAGIEVVQAILVLGLHGNRWADVNDLMSNTLGALLGYIALRRLLRFASFRRMIEDCSLVPRRSGERPPAIRS